MATTDLPRAEAPAGTRVDWHSNATKRRVKRRNWANWRLQFYGLASIGVATLLLCLLFGSLIHTGYVAFFQTKVALKLDLSSDLIDRENLAESNFRKITRNAFKAYFPDVTSPRDTRALMKIMSSGAQYIVRNRVIANPDLVGKTVTMQVPLSDPYDQLYKGVIPLKIDGLGLDRITNFRRLQNRNVVVVENGKSFVKTDVILSEKEVQDGTFNVILNEAFKAFFPRDRSLAYLEILGPDAVDTLKAYVEANPSKIGQTVSLNIPIAPLYDQLQRTGEAKIRNPRFKSDQELAWYGSLKERGLLGTVFAWSLFTNPDSRFPELAGLAGALVGTFLTLMVCFLLSFPLAIGAAIYLEEFAPKNRVSDIIEVNINNLAAVPSVVFGLLGLALFIGTFGLPRSVPLVGGMALSLMTLPTIIVATRAALKSVPPSIREAALGVGASKHQTIMHHVLPLAMPGILTGTIIGLAQALGETAPLLLIGMNAFIPSIQDMGITQPAMALPTQIYTWADSSERGFVSKTSAAILVLLCFLIIMNITAVILRKRFERKW
ncbi:MAG: phosphate ABC transporter permease PstA [Pseudomonadota bacterium]